MNDERFAIVALFVSNRILVVLVALGDLFAST